MKKLVSIGLVFIIAAVFCACGADKVSEETDLSVNTEKIEEAPGKDDATLYRTLEWKEELPSGETCYHFDFILTNTSKETVTYTIEGTFYDETGNIISEDYRYSSSVQSGQKYFTYLYTAGTEYDRVDYTITPSPIDLPAIDTTKAKYSFTSTGNDLEYIVSLTNGDDRDYTNCGLHIIFYNQGTITHIETIHLQNAEYRLNMGETESESFCFDGEYTEYEIYPFGEIIIPLE